MLNVEEAKKKPDAVSRLFPLRTFSVSPSKADNKLPTLTQRHFVREKKHLVADFQAQFLLKKMQKSVIKRPQHS